MPNALAHSIAEACVITGTGRTALCEAISRGELAARKRGRRTLIMADDLQRWLQSLPPIKVKGASANSTEGKDAKGRRPEIERCGPMRTG
jgi:excisionase family DNA binding protein